jgi:hypothetical protein
VSDTNFSGGSTITRTNTIDLSGVTNPAPAAVYQSQRFGNFTYTFSGYASGSLQTLRLHFADTHWTTANQRLFNVSINGTQVLSSFDVIGTAGAGNKALIEAFTMPATSSGTYVLMFTTVKDASTISGIEILPAVTSSVQVNCGGPAVGMFAADADFSGGSTITRTNTIDLSGVTSPAPAAVYQSQRFGNFTYTFSGYAAGSPHNVRLHFADTHWTAANQRLFNVSINGSQVLSNFDVIGTAGAGNKALIEAFTVPANASGAYVLTFTTVKDAATISGIEILPVVSSQSLALPHSGSTFHASSSYVYGNASGHTPEHQHYFYSAARPMPWNESGNVFAANDVLYTWVYVVPGDVPAQIMLQFYGSDGTWNHRAYWGGNYLTSGSTGAANFQVSSALPGPGWSQLTVTAGQVGLTGLSANGMAFTLYGGFVYWDDAGYLTQGNFPENVWVDDAPPAGATVASDGGDGWTWLPQAAVMSSAITGFSVQKSVNAAGEHQHYLHDAPSGNQLVLGTQDWLYCWIFIDPIATPSEVMLKWETSSGNWSRAYWGSNSITSSSGTTVYEGPIPPAAIGSWYKLTVSAASLGLAGARLSGIGFTLFNGAAYWDDAGRLAGGPGGQEYVWVDDAPVPGALLASDGGDHW